MPPLTTSAATTEAAAPPPPSAAASQSAAAAAPEEPEIVNAGGPLVDLDGKHVAPPPLGDGPKVAATGMLVPVHARPAGAAKKIGWLRAGAIVATKGEDAGKDGCAGGWRAIEPAGFVCVGDKVTTDLDDPLVRATARRPDASQKLPYMYGTVTRGGPVYAKIPTAADLEKFEPNLDGHIDKWKKDETSGASYGLELWYKWREKPSFSAWEAWEEKLTEADAVPFYLKDGGSVPDLSGLAKAGAVKIDQIDRRQGAAFLESFLWEGRRYNAQRAK